MRDAIFAFVLWAGWAAYSNYDYGLEKTLSIAMAQGFASLLTTLVLAVLVRTIFHNFHHIAGKLMLPTLITLSLSSSSLYFIHRLVATPNIIQTIIPPIIVAALYCLYLTRRHWYDSLAKGPTNE